MLLPQLFNPCGIHLCKIYAESAVPDPLLGAGRIDGAGEARLFLSLQRFWRIDLGTGAPKQRQRRSRQCRGPDPVRVSRAFTS